MVALIRRRSLLAIVVLTTLAVTIGAQQAQPASYKPCSLSVRDQDPPGGTPAYDLSVERRNTSCTTAKKVMRGFHSCRTESGHECNRKVLGRWRCSGRKDAGMPTFHGTFTCMSGKMRVRSTYRQDTPSCLGAAARDPKRRCVNPTRSVSRIDDVGWVCDEDAVPGACTFGYRGADTRGHFAIVGDSHVFHWRSPLNVVAQIERWRGYSISIASCFFSEAVGRWLQGCDDWYRSALAWFGEHPEVSTVFVTQNADTPIAVGPDETYLGVMVDGFQRAWDALPQTVKHVVVLRDTTVSTPATLACLERVIAAGTEPLATACPLARSVALRTDTAVEAVRQIRSKRYEYIDLADFLCAPRSCFPVVGGMQVNGDIWGHIDTAFTRTLGPYLLREIRRLMAAW